MTVAGATLLPSTALVRQPASAVACGWGSAAIMRALSFSHTH